MGIDQNNIDDSLACLPVYLSGCNRFLVLCGKTYLQRLWCLVEIFVFLEMGGDSFNLDVALLDTGGTCRSVFAPDRSNCAHAFSVDVAVESFDPKEAKCSK